MKINIEIHEARIKLWGNVIRIPLVLGSMGHWVFNLILNKKFKLKWEILKCILYVQFYITWRIQFRISVLLFICLIKSNNMNFRKFQSGWILDCFYSPKILKSVLEEQQLDEFTWSCVFKTNCIYWLPKIRHNGKYTLCCI